MAIASKKISDTMEWAKRLNFGRQSGLSNALEPALTSANIVMQTILGPPFEWWWNNEELVFTMNTAAATATITNVGISSGVLTVTCSNSFSVGQVVQLSGLTTATQLNGLGFVIASASSSQITANTTLGNYGPAADTGTVTALNTNDYTVLSPEFSHIEHASVLDSSQSPAKWIELEVKNRLSMETFTGRPKFISPHTEDGNGNVTFRVNPAPDKNYVVAVHVQKAPIAVTSLNQTWAPIPDYMQHVYNWGFLALMWLFADDPRYPEANQKFVAGLLAQAEGLDDEDRNIFLNNWKNLTSDHALKEQQGIQARGV
jgi:hypothetical protein